MGYKIGSFNCHNMGQNTSDDKIKKIAHIISEEQFDIIALQEIFCNGKDSGIVTWNSCNPPVSSLLKELGIGWKGFFAAPPQARDAREGYVFLWNTKRIRLPEVTLDTGEKRIFYPRIFNQYKLDKFHGQINLIRNPLYARFIPIAQPKMEFRLINTHIRFSKNSGKNSDNTDEIDLGDITMRRNEFNILSQTIYPKLCEKIYGEQDEGGIGSFYTILLGDYNLNLNRAWTQSPYFTSEEFFIGSGHDGQNRILKIYNEGLTTIKRITDGNEEEFKNQQKYNNNFDHVTFDKIRFSETNGVHFSVGKIDAVRKYDNNDFVHYRKEISDHIPIYLEFDNNYRA